MKTNYYADYLFDSISDVVVQNGAVQVDGTHISYVGKRSDAPAADREIELGNATIMPGLIDSHVHLTWCGFHKRPTDLVQEEGPKITTLRAASNATRHFRAGVTTVRDMGSSGIARDVRDAINKGVMVGPRVIACGNAIVQTGGHIYEAGIEADGPAEVAKAVRRELREGSDFIKMCASGGVYGKREGIFAPQYSVEELKVGADIARQAGTYVSVHAYGEKAIRNSLDAGVTRIEHGLDLTPELAERMAAEGQWLVSTMCCYGKQLEMGEQLDTPAFFMEKLKIGLEHADFGFRNALKAGVKIAAGSDCGGPGLLHEVLGEELVLMVGAGATEAYAVKTATAFAAEMIGIDDVTGTLSVGKEADIAVFDGCPLKNIRDIFNTKLTLRAGEQVYPYVDGGWFRYHTF